MCLHPKTISNNTYRFVPGKSKLSFDVSCGKCDDCRTHKKNDWFLRCYGEFMKNQAQGGSTFFLTLTYADEFLPHFDLRYKSLENGQIVEKHLNSPCFSYEDIHRFIKTLRQILKRRLGLGIKLRYIIFSEYGEKTQRPHYHCLFYISKRIHSRTFFECVDGYDNDVERRKFKHWNINQPYFITPNHPDGLKHRGAWRNGWVLVSKPSNGGMIVRSQKSIFYCAKYSTKDLAFYNKADVLDYQKSIFDSRLYNEIDRRKLVSELRHYLPVHYNSPSLGFDWLKELFLSDYNKYIREGITIQTGQKSSMSFNLPDYYKRKLLYRYEVKKNDDGTKKITWFYCPDAKELHLAYLRNNIMKFRDKLDVIFGSDFINILQYDDLVSVCHTHTSLFTYLQNIRKQYTSYQIAVFNYVYHCRSCRYDILDGSDTPVDDLLYYVSNYDKYYIRMIDNNDDIDYGEKFLVKHKDEYKYSYDSLSCFAGLSDFVAIVNSLSLDLKDYQINFRKFLDNYRDLFIPVCSHSVPSFDL